MAFDSIAVSKVSVTELFSKHYFIKFHLICTTSAVDVIDEDVGTKADESESLFDAGSRIQNKMKDVIDKYNKEQGIYNNPTLDTIVNDIQTNLNNWYT